MTTDQRLVVEGCAVATVDAEGTEYATGHLVIDGDRITAVGPGPAPATRDADRRIDGRGCLATPGLINTHHHLYQWATQGLAQESGLFDWLTGLYPVWARLDAAVTHDAALAGLAWLASTGTTTVADHHYIFGSGANDELAAEIDAARRVGVRLHACRGSMDLGTSAGGLPPDAIVEDTDGALAATQAAIDAHHDAAPEAMVRIAAGPCSPFSVTGELLRGAAELARAAGVRLHTHIAESHDEERFCRERFGVSPVEYLAELGWLGTDVWLAHGVHLDGPAVARLGGTGTGVAHCPTSNARLASGVAPVRALVDAGAPVGVGVDGPASAEGATLAVELHQALLSARTRAALRGAPDPAAALSAREALELGTRGGARCLGRDAELGSLEPGKLADVALWRVDGPGHAPIADPVAALVLAAVPPPVDTVLVGGRPIAHGGELRTVDPRAATRAGQRATRILQHDAEVRA